MQLRNLTHTTLHGTFIDQQRYSIGIVARDLVCRQRTAYTLIEFKLYVLVVVDTLKRTIETNRKYFEK